MEAGLLSGTHTAVQFARMGMRPVLALKLIRNPGQNTSQS